MDQIYLVQEEPRGPSQLIEMPVAAGQQRVNFPDVQQLRSTTDMKIITKMIRFVTLDVLAAGVINPGVNAPLVDCQNAVLVLYCEGWEKAQFIPLLTLSDTAIPGGTFPFRFHQTNFNNWENVDWPKSYIQFTNGYNASTNFLFIFDVAYERLNAQGLVMKRANP